MTDYMVTGLVKKRAELAGELERTHERLRELVQQLEHLDATLRLVAPDVEVEAIRPKAFRPPDDWSKRGQMSRLVLSILRQAKEPLTSREIAAQMLLERALDTSDQRMLRTMTKRVSTALRDQREKGRVESEDGPGTYQLWSVSRSEAPTRCLPAPQR
ncbi:MAG: hypothetical protein ACK4K7_10495 [Allosphingosinicella sp.]|uniref:hypothetical protein n=1 Tax=Allosphingosinicella sp. TaxID=2823234 RepID=UPI0039609D49